jgi:hypothetical protein
VGCKRGIALAHQLAVETPTPVLRHAPCPTLAVPARHEAAVLELLRQNSAPTAGVNELLAQNKALLARIAELEANHGKPSKTPDNSSMPPSRGQMGTSRSHCGASARREPGRETRHLRRRRPRLQPSTFHTA